MIRRLLARYGATMCVAGALSGACGGSANSTPTSPSNPTPGTTVAIGVAGVVPIELEVPIGTQVTFINGSNRPHDMTSDPHPAHTDCTAINSVGLIMPGQQRETGNLVRARTCGYHDHSDPDNAAFKGTILIR